MFTIYSTSNCNYCQNTKTLLQECNREYLEIILDTPEKKKDFKTRTGFKTVPQIYLEDHHIGGYEELVSYLKGV